MNKKWNDITENHLSALAVGVSLVCLSFLYFAVHRMTQTSNIAPQFVVVDMQALLHQQAQKLVLDPFKKDESEELKQLRLSALAQKIKEGIEKYAFEKGVVVLNKGSVMGGKLIDVTNQIHFGNE